MLKSNDSFSTNLIRSSFALSALLYAFLNLGLYNASQARPATLDKSMFKNDWLAKHYGHLGAWWIAKDYLEQKTAPDVVVFGSSQMGGLQAADAATAGRRLDFVSDHESLTLESELQRHQLSGIRSFTAALPGAMISDHFLLSRALFSERLKPRLVVLGLSPRDFIDATLPAASATEPYTLLSKFANLGPVDGHYYDNLSGRAERMFSQSIPLRQLCRAQVLPDFFDCAGNIRPGVCTIDPDRKMPFVDNTYEYKQRYRKPICKSLPQQFQFLNDFLASMEQQNIKTLVVGMPLMPSNRALLSPQFWSSFRAGVSNVCAQHGATWMDMSTDETFTANEFVDTVHTNANGGSKLAKAIADRVSSDVRLASALLTNRNAPQLAVTGKKHPI